MWIKDRMGDGLRIAGEFLEDQWFDRTRNVRTRGNVSLERAAITRERRGDSESYQPARPRHIRRALREMPLREASRYSYIDLGSGKGRSLFVAAELPFRRVIGVEFSDVLHAQAAANTRSFRRRKGGCADVESIHDDAGEFVFPAGALVLYMFNPFGAATMARVLRRLEESLVCEPRHVVVVLLWPRCGDQVAAVPGMRLCGKRREYEIYEAGGTL